MNSEQLIMNSEKFGTGNSDRTESDQPLVSVIIPVCNTESYLAECLDSAVNQTYRNLQIIPVDDGSTDRSLEIMQSFAARDKRVAVLSQPNRGVSAARNAGLRVARGDYVFFVDSDDTVRTDAVETLCRQAVKTGADIVLGNVYFCHPDGRQVPVFRRLVRYAGQPLMSGAQCFSQLMEDDVFPPSAVLYFTRRSFIMENELFFQEGIVHEDELWCIQALVLAPQVSVTDFFYYFYRQQKGSIMRSDDNKMYRIRSFFSVVRALEAFVAGLQEKWGKEGLDFAEAAGFVYVRIFNIYLFICRLLKEIADAQPANPGGRITNEYRPHFEQLLKKVSPTLNDLRQHDCFHFFRAGNSLLYTRSAGLTLSFCITCKNRFHQISRTLPQNLNDNRDAKDVIEFVPVDFGSTDGLQEWVKANFMAEIEAGYLKYYCTEELPFWHASVAKNTAHMYATHQIAVNLDCDNLTGKDGGLFVIDNMLKYGPGGTIIHQFDNEWNGTYGRIALSKSNFIRLGGYDESFEPSGFQDTDLLLRAQLKGLFLISLPDPAYSKAIPNTIEEKMAYTSSDLSWHEMDAHNRQLSLKNITSGKLKANENKEHIGIVDNIYTFK